MTPPSRSPNKSPSGSITPQESDSRKRVVKACDRCRLKKIKCDGQLPCSRCQAENTVCRYGERKKSTERRIPPGYVDYLEDQQKLLVMALKKSRAQGLTSSSASLSSSADPSVHTILEELGVLSEYPSHRSEEGFHFEEDLETLRQQCEDDDLTEQLPFRLASSPEPMGSIFTPDDLPRPQDTWFPGTTPQPVSLPRMTGFEQQRQQQQQQQQIQLQQARNPQMQQTYQSMAQPVTNLRPQGIPTELISSGSAHSQEASRRSSTQASTTVDWGTGTARGQPPVNLAAPQPLPLDVSTVSPSDLSLPTALDSYPRPDEEAWARWLNEQRESTRLRQLSTRLSARIGTDFDTRTPTPENQCYFPPGPRMSQDSRTSLNPKELSYNNNRSSSSSNGSKKAKKSKGRKTQNAKSVSVKSEEEDLSSNTVWHQQFDEARIPDVTSEDDQEYLQHLNQVLGSSMLQRAIKMEVGRMLGDEDDLSRLFAKRRKLDENPSPIGVNS